MRAFAIALSLGVISTAVFAQVLTGTPRTTESPFTRSDAPALSGPCDYQFPSRIPIRCWTDQKFMVMPRDLPLRVLGYPTLWRNFPGEDKAPVAATYSELAGKVITVTEVEWRIVPPPGTDHWTITFVDESARTLYATDGHLELGQKADDAFVPEFALLRDLEQARAIYLNKTYWMLTGNLPQLGENGALPTEDTPVVTFHRLAPVTVSDVLVGGNPDKPVRIVLKNDAGQEGFIDIAVSLTNQGPNACKCIGDGALIDILSSTDPHLAHKWPDKIWQAIEAGKVLRGMSKEQVRLSWGKPTDVSDVEDSKGKTRVKWKYGKLGEVEFENGLVIGGHD